MNIKKQKHAGQEGEGPIGEHGIFPRERLSPGVRGSISEVTELFICVGDDIRGSQIVAKMQPLLCVPEIARNIATAGINVSRLGSCIIQREPWQTRQM